VICSKSTWIPAIRREHSLADLAREHGHRVTFIERPLDIRAARTLAGAREWRRGALGIPRGDIGKAGIEVRPSACLSPGHLGRLSEKTSSLMLGRLLRGLPRNATVVVNVPWQWPATAFTHARRVLDCADDWGLISGERDSRVLELYERIGREADAIVVANPALADYFPAGRTSVVRNGVAEDMLVPVAAQVKARQLIHAGTLTPRFDVELAAALLDQLPDWRLDLYGQCQYPRLQERPSPELSRLLTEYNGRVRWHGVLARERLAVAIDEAAVALVLNRPALSAGQDSMKLYDYAARGRPIVTTRFSERLEQDGPPHLHIAEDARAMARAIVASAKEPAVMAEERRSWARAQRWESRWPAWSAAAFGSD
jgi:glycosyltransferase involved in cell wall biosynthesis